jgi:hypothetical protein
MLRVELFAYVGVREKVSVSLPLVVGSVVSDRVALRRDCEEDLEFVTETVTVGDCFERVLLGPARAQLAISAKMISTTTAVVLVASKFLFFDGDGEARTPV